MKATWLLGTVLLTFLATGCGSERDKGINRDKDRPAAADAAKKK